MPRRQSRLARMKKLLSVCLSATLALAGSSAATGASQTETLSWGLDRIDQPTAALDSRFTYPDSAGAGVRIYIVDTGVQATNTGFAGRVATGYDALARLRDPNQSSMDCSGHGTAVAGIAASSVYGVAKAATIVPVRVATCSGGVSADSLVKGIDWIIKNHPRNSAGVVNISLAVNKSKAVDTAIDRLYTAGLVPVVAAGNFASDACRISPAGAPRALVVGATSRLDHRVNTSNFGECVKVFAPGASIMTEGLTAPVERTGTSFAAPLVSGAIALYLNKNPKARPAEVIGTIVKSGQSGVVVNSNLASSVLLNIEFLNR